MKDNKSPGVDGIAPKILKETVEQISKPLAHVFNMSLQEGIVPLEWKEANIIPLFKKGSRNKSVNYRPVSLTSVICKLLESIIRDHIMDFLIKHKLINSSQHGFLKSKSCLTNLLCFFEEITKWVDEGSPVDIIYLDFQKAFDKVPHQILILKLKSHGIGISIINWIEQWLTDRRQRVVVERERERQVYLQPDGLDSNTYNTYNINIIKYLQYGRHTGTTNICLLPIVQSPWY